MKNKKRKMNIVSIAISCITACLIFMAIGLLCNTSDQLTYEEFIEKADVNVEEASIGTFLHFHQKIYGVDGIKYRYKLQTDCPHWKYDDRYVSDEELPYKEDNAAIETEAKELTIRMNGETLVVAQHFYVPMFDLYDEDITFDEFKDKQLHIAYDTFVENSKSNLLSWLVLLPLLVLSLLFLLLVLQDDPGKKLDHIDADVPKSKGIKKCIHALHESKEHPSKNTKIVMTPSDTYMLPIKEGYLDITVSTDPNYPGIDMEYVSDHEKDLPDDALYTRPRVLLEVNENILRAAIWADPQSEDFSTSADFTCVEDM